MLRYSLKEEAAATAIEKAVEKVIAQGFPYGRDHGKKVVRSRYYRHG
jgi:isocitrate/isopropylmalate dehydrogenase